MKNNTDIKTKEKISTTKKQIILAHQACACIFGFMSMLTGLIFIIYYDATIPEMSWSTFGITFFFTILLFLIGMLGPALFLQKLSKVSQKIISTEVGHIYASLGMGITLCLISLEPSYLVVLPALIILLQAAISYVYQLGNRVEYIEYKRNAKVKTMIYIPFVLVLLSGAITASAPYAHITAFVLILINIAYGRFKINNA